MLPAHIDRNRPPQERSISGAATATPEDGVDLNCSSGRTVPSDERRRTTTRAAGAERRPRRGRHAGRVRVAGGDHDPARHRGRPRWDRLVRLGHHGVLPRDDDRDRLRRRSSRPPRRRPALRGRAGPVRRRPDHRWPGSVDARARGRPFRAGASAPAWCRRSATWRSAERSPMPSGRGCSPCCRRRGWSPG